MLKLKTSTVLSYDLPLSIYIYYVCVQSTKCSSDVNTDNLMNCYR